MISFTRPSERRWTSQMLKRPQRRKSCSKSLRRACCRSPPAPCRAFGQAGLSGFSPKAAVIAAGSNPDETGNEAGGDDVDGIHLEVLNGVLFEHTDIL